MPESVPGIHHVTAITGDVQRNVDFHVGVLGLRFIKKTVNFDVPDTYHIYFGDGLGTPGTAVTFFGWPFLPPRRPGNGQVNVISYAVPGASLDYWTARLKSHGLESRRSERFGAGVISFADPDQIQLELIGEASDDRWQPWQGSAVPEDSQIRGFHSVGLGVREAEPSARFLVDTMGFRKAGTDGGRHRFETGQGGPGAVLELLADAGRHDGEEAVGTVHHVAWRALDDPHEMALREVLIEAGCDVTPVIDRKYFHSIYFREPGGVLFEIATDQPGFTVDEATEDLGTGLQLPPHAEGNREDLAFNLQPIVVPVASRAPGR